MLLLSCVDPRTNTFRTSAQTPSHVEHSQGRTAQQRDCVEIDDSLRSALSLHEQQAVNRQCKMSPANTTRRIADCGREEADLSCPFVVF